MSVRKDVKFIKEKIEKMTNRTIHNAEKFSELKDYLEKLVINVKEIRLYIDEYGKHGVKIKYDIPEISIIFDDNNDVIKNDLFYSINMLDLLNEEDVKKIHSVLEKARNMNNQL